MNRDDADRVTRACVREVAPEADLDVLAPDADLRETLRLDSLDFLRFVELLSEQTGRRIDEDEYNQLSTMAGVVAFVSTPETG
jgi:acyl carrier protein